VIVRDRMTTELTTVGLADPIRRAWDLIEEEQLRRFPVVEGDRLVGIVTDRDVRNAIASSVVLTEKRYHDFLLDTVKIESIMTADPVTVTPDTQLRDAAQLLLDLKVGGLPVVEQGRLVGIITETDMIETLIELLPD
jgi:acetoin utilization protein AcuB